MSKLSLKTPVASGGVFVLLGAFLVFDLSVRADDSAAVWVNTNQSAAAWSTAANWVDNTPPSDGGSVDFSFPTFLYFQQNSNTAVALMNAYLSAGTSWNLSSISGLNRYAVALQGTRKATDSATKLSVRDPSNFAGVFRSHIDRDSGTRGTPVLSLAAEEEHIPTVNHLDVRNNLAVEVPEAGTVAEVLDVVGEGALVKKGAGTLSVAMHGGVDSHAAVETGTLEIRGGVDVEPGLAPDPYFHVDASDPSTLTFTEVDGVHRVSRVADASGGEVAAELYNEYPGPLLVSNVVNGLSVLDFGALAGKYASKPAGDNTSVYGLPAALVWTTRPKNVREVFVVWRNKQLGSIPFPISALDSAPFPVHVDLLDSPRLRIDDSWCSTQLLNGDMRINDVPMYPGASFESTVFNVWSYGFSGNMPLDTFALDRSTASRIGGVQLAEVVVYTRALTSAERTAINRHLMRKWMGGPFAAITDVNSLRVSSNAEIKVRENENVTVRHTVAGDGRLVKTGGGTLLSGATTAIAGDGVFGLASVLVKDGAFGTLEPEKISGSNTHHAAAFHLDASADDSFTLNEDGSISEWRDVRPEGTMTAVASSVYMAPLLVKNALGGLPVVDLGTFYYSPNYVSADEGVYSDSGWFLFDPIDVREAFFVIRDKTAKSTAFFLGNTDRYVFHRGADGKLVDGDYASGFAARGAWRVDGVPVNPLTYALDTSFHLVSFSLQKVERAQTLGWDRGHRCGGQEIAEVILFTEPLSPAERRSIEAGLLAKWFGKAHPEMSAPQLGTVEYESTSTNAFIAKGDVNVSLLSGRGVLTKEGDGELTAGVLKGFTGVNVLAGTLTVSDSVRPNVLNEAFFHIDPSNESTLLRDDNGCVTNIVDVRKNGRCAEVFNYALAPTTVADGAASLNVMDFGDYYYNGNGKTLPAEVGKDSAALKWNEIGKNIHTVFMVFADTAEDKDLPVIGSTEKHHMNRGGKTGGTLVDTTYAIDSLRNGNCKFFIDGVEASTTETPIPSGLHVLTIVLRESDDGMTLNLFGQDRLYRWGGVRIGETAVFERALTDAERVVVSDYLKAKWLEKFEPSSISTEGGTLNITHGLSIPTGAKLKAVWSQDDAAAINVAGGVASFGSDVEVDVQVPDGVVPTDGRVTLFSFTSGAPDSTTLATWRLIGVLAEKFNWRFKADNNSVYLNLLPLGCMIYIR